MRESKSQSPHPTLPKTRKPAPPPGTPEHEEWLLDEAGEETFPASDPGASAQPGSTLTVNKIADEGRETCPTEESLKNKEDDGD
jgi:hypothetical protein